MEEFNTLEKVRALFEGKNCIGKENHYVVLMQDIRKYSGMAAGMEYPYHALLMDQTEDGIGYFYLVQPKLSLKILLEKLVVNKESYTFLRNEDIVSVQVKKYALFDSKRKSIVIKTKDKKTHYLYAKVEDNLLPYHNENFAKFIEKYSDK